MVKFHDGMNRVSLKNLRSLLLTRIIKRNENQIMGKLLERAKSILPGKREHKYTKDDYELVEAWLRGEIGLKQLQIAKNLKAGTMAYSYIAFVSRELMSQNGI